MKKTITICLLLLVAAVPVVYAATTDANFTLDDGVTDSPQLILQDADDKALSLQKTDAGAANIINTDGDMNFKPSNDADDYILMNTALNAPFLGWEIAGLAYANDPGFRVDPATGKLQYRDQNGAGWTALADMASGATATFASLTDVSLAGLAQGAVLYWNGTDWVNLGAGANGYFLKTQGAGANPIWADVAASGVTLDKAYDQGTTITADAGAVAITTPNNSNNQVFTATQNDTANNPVAVTIANTGTGNGLFLNQDGNGVSINIDTEASTSDAVTIDGTTLTTGSLLGATIDDTLTANTALIDISSAAANDDFRLVQATLTDGNGADVDAVYLDRDTNDARIFYNDATEKWQIDQGDGLGLINIGAGSSGNVAGADTQVQYNNGGAFGGAAAILYDDSDGSTQFKNGTDSTTGFQVMDADAGTPILNVDTTSELVGIGTAAPEGLLEVQGVEAADSKIYLDADDGDDNGDTWIIASQAADNDLTLTNHVSELFRVQDGGNVGIDEASPGARLEVNPDDTDNAIGVIVDQDDTTNNPVALQVENAGTGNGVFVNQDGNGISVNVDSESTTVDVVNLDGSTLTTGNLIQGVVTDAINTGTALINVTGTAVNTATGITIAEISTTPANDVDITAVKIERGANDARIVYDEGTTTWQLDQGAGAGLVSIATGAGGSGDITAVGSMTSGDAFADATADDDWLGLGAAAGRIEFDDQGTDEVNILGANVGIGTSTPGAKVEISGASQEQLFKLSVVGTTTKNGFTTRSDSGGLQAFWDLNLGTTGNANGIQDASKGAIRFYEFNDQASGDPTFGIQMQRAAGAWNPDFFLTAAYNASNNPIIYTGTNVSLGIGTTAPDKAFEINHATGSNLRLTYNDSNGSAANYADFTMADDGALTIQTAGTDEDIEIRTGTYDNAIFIDDSASMVGIGDATPSYTLDVNGDAQIQGGELYITPAASSASTVEGTIYYDSDDDNLYVYANGGFVDLTAGGGGGTPGGADTQVQYNNGGAFGGAAAILYDDSDGSTQFKNATDSTTGFQVMDADAGTPILNVDTTSEYIGIRTAAPGAPLSFGTAIEDKIRLYEDAGFPMGIGLTNDLDGGIVIYTSHSNNDVHIRTGGLAGTSRLFVKGSSGFVGFDETNPQANVQIAPDDADNAIGLIVDQDDTGTSDAVQIKNDGTGDAVEIDQNGQGALLTVDSEGTTVDQINLDVNTLTTGDVFDIDMNAVTTGNVMDIALSADTISTNTSLFKVTGTAIDTATGVRLLEIATTAANDVDVTAVAIEQGANDPRIFYDQGATAWYLDQGDGSAVAISTGSATVAGADTQVQYNNGGAFGGAAAILYDDSDGSTQFKNGTDSTTGFQVMDADAGTPILNVDTTSELVGIGTAAPEGLLEVQGVEAADSKIYLDADDGDDNGDTWIIASQAADNDLTFTNHVSELLRVQDGGNVGIDEATPGARLEVNPDDTDNAIGLIVDQDDTTNNPVALQVENAGTGNGVLVTQTGNGVGLNINTSATTADAITISGGTLTSGSLLSATVDDTLSANTALIDISSSSADDDFRLMQASLTGGGATDIEAIYIDRDTVDARIFYNNAANKWQLDQGAGAGLVDIATGAGGSGDITDVGSMDSGDAFKDADADDDWLGLGAAAGRIEFDDQATDEVNVLGANVGIGTNTPSKLLHVTGNVLFGASTAENAQLIVRADAGQPAMFVQGDPARASSSDLIYSVNRFGIGGGFQMLGDHTMIVGSPGNEFKYVGANGNIGAGTTAPDRRLEINSATGINLRLTNNDSDGSAANYADLLTTATGDLIITPSGSDILLSSDTAKLNFGAGTDASITFDSDSLNITANAVTATDDLILTADEVDVAATHLEVPSGAAPTVDEEGHLAVDTTADDLIYYGTAKRSLPYEMFKSITIEYPANGDNFLIFKAPYPITVTAINAIVDPADAGESVNITLQERNSTGGGAAAIEAEFGADNDGASVTGVAIDDNSVAEGGWVSLNIGTVTGTVTQVVVTITYVKTAE